MLSMATGCVVSAVGTKLLLKDINTGALRESSVSELAEDLRKSRGNREKSREAIRRLEERNLTDEELERILKVQNRKPQRNVPSKPENEIPTVKDEVIKDGGDSIKGGTVTLQTGGRQIDYNAYIKRLETIDMEYENIRINTTDISKIAQNTGMPEWKISRIKEHVFSNEHILDSGVKRFDADPEIADAWYRLTNGTFNQNDIDLLNHEYFESKFESFYKTDYRTAHSKTEESGRIWDPYKEDN